MNNKIIVPTGYMGTGSSAVTDLLKEYTNISCTDTDFEFVFLHISNGVFDLEKKLLDCNNAIRSDEAIRSFIKTMKSLNNDRFFWPGRYKKYISTKFLTFCDEYVNELVDGKYNDLYSYYNQKPNLLLDIEIIIKKIVYILSLKKIYMKVPLAYKGMYLSYPTSEEFFNKSKSFIYKIANEVGLKSSNVVMDQLLLPHNLYKINNYFNDDIRIIVVDRDPRDLFILNKYYWPRKNMQVPYPTDVNEFCKIYRKIREIEKEYDDKKILRIHFEDLIYKYEHTVNKIENFISMASIQHVKKTIFFNAKKSINNTQLFLDGYNKEITIIENNLSDFLYNFPKKTIQRNNDIF